MKRNRSNDNGKADSVFKQILLQLSSLVNRKRRKQLIIILKRILQVYGINLIFFVNKWKLKKLQGVKIQLDDLMPWLRESTILVLLNILYPALKKLPILGNDYVHWTSMVGISLMLTKGEVPSWIFAHLLIEVLHSKSKDSEIIRWLKRKFSQGTWTKFKQVFVCSMMVVLFKKLDRNSLSFRALFDYRPFLTDFVTINGISSLLSIYRRVLKSAFTSSTKANKSGSNHDIRNFSQSLGVKNHDDWPISSSNLKHVMDRLNEIYEITTEDNYASLSEKIINSCFVKGIIPSLRWAIIRQCIEYLFAAKRRMLMNNKLRWIVMLLTFTLIDPKNKMVISPLFVKLLAKTLVNVYLKKYWHHNFQKYILFFMFQFSIT
ncbi:hypothetical protein GRS66_007789 [Saccharomyces pastorianus]|uniref:Uncharacterized protein n=2 Tax=Saccharomyces TaxID=4930 RepID=A0A6C1E9H4_SACPS|nr:hypothetical protein DI49_2132 [Saccharomyces eubayanus]KOG99655.1 hypothetical protein DI49_2132 [Saccharomyces eubayanus]QID85224.1 hypothetical protein GRS66_007789 [Saccharomyces pastorianus]CAI2010434.1 hypothetical protein SEUBUCD650_0G04180 [Saccharomyces eubayanus]